MKKQKICIIGDGLTGLTAALALSRLNVKVHLFAKFQENKNSLDNRTTAISPSNHKFLLKLLKKNNSKLFWPSTKIDLYHEQENKYFYFMNFENYGKNLMYIIENYKLRKILFERIKNQKNLKIIRQEVKKIEEKNSIVFFKNNKICYDFILICAGKKSQLVQKFVGRRIIKNDSNEIAFTTIVKHKEKIFNAKQYFLKEGPLAILPISKDKFSLVWSVNKRYDLKTIENLMREKLKKILKSNCEIELSKINFFPISFKFNVNFSKKNILILGEGSYNMHPVAGQGFNLILRDIQKLHEEIEKYLCLGMEIKDSPVFHKFTTFRKPEKLLFGLGVSFVNRFFKYDKITQPAKKIILKDINKFKFLKDISLRISDIGIY